MQGDNSFLLITFRYGSGFLRIKRNGYIKRNNTRARESKNR